MTNERKKQVKDALMRYAGKFSTQSLAAESLQGVSSSVISQIKNNNWDLLSDRLWNNIARQVGFYCGEWQAADTGAYLLLRILFSDAQHYGMNYGVSIAEGLGKTFAASHYVRENENTWYVPCSEAHNRRSFMSALFDTAGIDRHGTVPEMMQVFYEHTNTVEEPLLILDDAHKLKDRVLHLVVLLANGLSGRSGIIIMGNGQLRTRIIDGVRRRKIGYDEIFKSIGKRIVTLNSLGPRDLEMVCMANGVFEAPAIAYIKENCGNNLHTATQLIQQSLENRVAA